MRLLLKSLGPGVVTGAADDDPSGIATLSVAGAQLGTKLLWTALLTWPLMAAVQMMCARIGMVTGQGLAGNFKQRFPRWLLRVFIVALLAANTINIAADLAGMADAAEMLSGINSHWFVVVFALLISWATVRLGYQQIANVLKWLVLVLFAYPITTFVVGADWSRVARATVIPSMPHTRDEWSMLVAILGTTISPYLFFWQASEEVEEEKAAGQSTLAKRRGATAIELQLRKKEGKQETVIPKMSQETLAEMIGTTRPRVSFFMNRFRKLGFIDYDGGSGLQVHSSLLSIILHD
jgi:NRAMP (natural resistance-associated macrophage protein)-like metal ion transporter